MIHILRLPWDLTVTDHKMQLLNARIQEFLSGGGGGGGVGGGGGQGPRARIQP